LDAPDQVKFILQQPSDGLPGSGFNYSTGNPHLISAMINKKAGKSLEAYAKEKLFAPLDIKSYRWDSDKQGVSFGGTGLYLTTEDMAKIGYLYANRGKVGERQILTEKWVIESTALNVKIPSGFTYGYQWWGGQNYFFANGSYGQGIFVAPDQQLIMAITSNLSRAATNVTNSIFEQIRQAVRSGEPIPANAPGYEQLQEQLRLSGSPRQEVPPLPGIAKEISSRKFKVASRTNKNEIYEISLEFQPSSDTAVFKRTFGTETSELLVGLDNVYRDNNGFKMKGHWDGEEFVIEQHAQNPKRIPSDALFTFRFNGTRVEMDFTALSYPGSHESFESVK
jgi:hypothetical protein